MATSARRAGTGIIDQTTADTLEVEGLPRDGKIWVVRWYLGFERNASALSEPGVRLLLTNTADKAESRTVTVGLTSLGQVRLYTKWTNRRSVGNYCSLAQRDAIVIASQASCESRAGLRESLGLQASTASVDSGKFKNILVVSSSSLDCQILIPTVELFWQCKPR